MTESGFPITGWTMNYHEADGYLLKNMGRVGAEGRAVLRVATLRNATVIEEPDDD